ncbi:DUF6233 domain-containing protein [Streptomyces sp. st140]|uniref:DUF6233 domain-containing protein n=1 Tax=Streptomyces sp. st140 TaxID=1828052 RepID=UPI000BF179A3|nr:DUF6233 domain-containing protein [Streptomyces sp. st140]
MSRAPESPAGPGDLPPDLERLRTLETWLVLSLGRVREQIAVLERPAGPARTPDWGVSEAGTGVGISAAEVHRGDCWAQGRTLRPVSAERARAELAGGMRACAVCRPDTVLNRQ